MENRNKKFIIPLVIIIIILIVLVIIGIIYSNNTSKLPQATISDFNKVKLVLKEEIDENYIQLDIQKYTYEYQAYRYLVRKENSIKVENLSEEDKMSMLMYKLNIYNEINNNYFEVLKDYENEKEYKIEFNNKTYEMSNTSIKADKFIELYEKEYGEKFKANIKTFSLVYDNLCDNLIVHYLEDINSYVLYIDTTKGAKACEINDGVLVAYYENENKLSLYESKNGKIVAEYQYDKKDNEYVFKSRIILNELNKNIEKIEFGNNITGLERDAYLAYINESTKKDNNSFNPGNNVCVSLDWLTNNGYYKNDANLKGSVLFEHNNDEINLTLYVNNGKYSLQSIDDSGFNKITDTNILTTTNCNHIVLKDMIYCDKNCNYEK